MTQMFNKAHYDRTQKLLAKQAKARRAAKEAGEEWKFLDSRENKYWALKAEMNKLEALRSAYLKG